MNISNITFFTFLFLSTLISCNQSRSSFNKVHGETKHTSAPLSSHYRGEIPASDEVIVIEETKADPNIHELVIEIDQVNSRFTVTGNAGRVCGINFEVVDRLDYEMLSADQARITHNGKVYELSRIDNTDGEKIFGIWTTDIVEGVYQGNVIFHIRLDPVMKLEADCELNP